MEDDRYRGVTVDPERYAAMDGANEIRWGYNGLTGEVIAVKAWSHNLDPVVTHLDMAERFIEGYDWAEDTE